MALRENITNSHHTHRWRKQSERLVNLSWKRNASNTTERIVLAMLSLYSKAYGKGTKD